MKKPFIRLMLDSGAFSAWQQNQEIPLRKYIRFCQKNRHLLAEIINLDVIPKNQTPHDAEDAAKKGWQNFCQMQLAGLNPIPVYHLGERRYWLEKMVGEGAKYIGIGGIAKVSAKVRRPWLDSIFEYLRGGNPYPHIKVHGFGVTSVEMMLRYPWASVDSVSWMKQAVVGSVTVPKLDPLMGTTLLRHHPDHSAAFCYAIAPINVALSESGKKGPSANALSGFHFNSLGKETRAWIEAYFDLNKITVTELKKEYKKRVRLNARFYREFEKKRPDTCGCVVNLSKIGLFSDSTVSSTLGCGDPPSFRLYLSVGTYLEYSNILREEKCRNQLVSYHRIMNGPRFSLEDWVKSGYFCRSTRPGKVIV